MVTNDVIRDLIVQRVNAGVIRLEALKAGMITLRQDGWRKVLNGTTTVDEVARVDGGGHQLDVVVRWSSGASVQAAPEPRLARSALGN